MRNFIYTITPKRATKLAQDAHNDIDENGNTNCEAIIENVADQIRDEVEKWLEENIDWTEIAYADMDAREDYREFMQAKRAVQVGR